MMSETNPLADLPASQPGTDAAPTAKKIKAPKPAKLPERDVQTWFRLTSKNLYTRERFLDIKANIMLSVNAVILSVIGSTAYPNFAEYPHVVPTLVIVAITNLVSIAFAINATAPHVMNKGHFTKEQVAERDARLMTFEDFYGMELDEYASAVGEVIKSQEFLHNTLIKDIYFLGIDLARRHRALMFAYRSFQVGIVLATISFVVCSTMWGIQG